VKIPSDQQPEGGNKGGENEGGENEGGENEGGENDDELDNGGEGSLPNGPTELDNNLIGQLADAVIFASPLRVAGDLTEAQFVDLDLGGVITTSTQHIDGCRFVSFDDEMQTINISLDCGDLGGNAPTGNIACQLTYPTLGAAALDCRVKVQSAVGTTTGKVNVNYEFGADSAHITVHALAPQTLMSDIEVEATHDIQNLSSFNADGTTQQHDSRLFVTTDNKLYSVSTANVFRTSNDCRPAVGQFTIDTFDSWQDDDGDRFVLAGFSGSWFASDGAGSTIEIPLCN